MGLFKPKWVRESEAKDRAAAKAQKAVERLTDPNDLIRVALESPWGTAQLSAVARLDDDAALLALGHQRLGGGVQKGLAEGRGGGGGGRGAEEGTTGEIGHGRHRATRE